MTAPKIFTPEYDARMRANESGGWWNAGMRAVAEQLLEEARLPERGVVLDVGCGSGQTMRWFVERHAGWRAAGLDITPDGVRAARRGGELVSRATALALPHPDASVDLVLTLDVVQHLPLAGGAANGSASGDGDRTALAEMRRVLRPGGWLFLRTNAQAFPRVPDDPRYDYRKYEPGALRSKLVEAGFEVVRLSRINALLGLAEIPRELKAAKEHGAGYQGVLAPPPRRRAFDPLLAAWLTLEGRAVRRGWRLPLGRALVALCRAGSAKETR